MHKTTSGVHLFFRYSARFVAVFVFSFSEHLWICPYSYRIHIPVRLWISSSSFTVHRKSLLQYIHSAHSFNAIRPTSVLQPYCTCTRLQQRFHVYSSNIKRWLHFIDLLNNKMNEKSFLKLVNDVFNFGILLDLLLRPIIRIVLETFFRHVSFFGM